MTDRELLEGVSNTTPRNFDSINHRLANIETHHENVTDNNIEIIAEGHLDSAGIHDDAPKVNNEKELLLICKSYLEDEIKKIKDRLAQIS